MKDATPSKDRTAVVAHQQARRSKLADPLFCISLAAAILLGVLFLSFYFFGKPEVAFLPLAWFAAANSFLVLATLGLAFLALGRYHVLRDSSSFWIGLGFASFGVGCLFYTLSFPALLPNGGSLLARFPGTAAWIVTFTLSLLDGFLLASVLVRWPSPQALAGARWLWMLAACFGFVSLTCSLFLRFEPYLPLLVTTSGVFTPGLLAWEGALSVTFAAGALLSCRRYLASRDMLLGYASLGQVAFAFSMLALLLGGRRYTLWWFVSRVIVANGVVAIMFGVLVEYVRLYADRKRAQEAVRESEARYQEKEATYRAMVEAFDGLIYVCSKDYHIEYMNRPFIERIGRDATGELCYQALYGSDSVCSWCRKEQVFAGETARWEVQTPADGRWYYAVNTPIFHPDGAISKQAMLQDISDRKWAEQALHESEERLRQVQKMEAIGRLAGGIAHDFNNLLMVIRNYTEMLEDSLAANDALRQNTRAIMKAADRAASLTGQMLAFSRKQIVSPVVLDLNAVIHETAKMLKRLIGEDIEFRVDTPEFLWAVEADSDQMVQVLMNFCVNARDAMPQGGTLTIATRNVTVGKEGSDKRPYVAPGDYVELSVTDTGVGISKETQQRIFEPFFTTKEVGKGTGLGLATVYGVIKQNGGYVWVDSEPGHGACFTIYLPRVSGAITPAAAGTAETWHPGTGTLLVAEDEPFLREAICSFLRRLGYTVLEASSGQEALVAVKQQEKPIDLLITDVVMPKLSGRELSQMLESLYPNLKVIYMSGYTEDAVLRHGIQRPGAIFLQKPFSLGTLARKVRDTLEVKRDRRN